VRLSRSAATAWRGSRSRQEPPGLSPPEPPSWLTELMREAHTFQLAVRDDGYPRYYALGPFFDDFEFCLGDKFGRASV
jgi:hypothetical protein